jgi:hypothetical protein
VTHASLELLEAIRGVAPWANGNVSEIYSACGEEDGREWPAFASIGWAMGGGTCDDTRPVDCPRCLVAIDAALEGRLLEGK